MYWQIEAPGITMDIVELKSSSTGDRLQQFSSQDEAARFLEEFSINWQNFDQMIAAIESTGEAASTGSHQEAANQLARLIVTDRLRLRRSNLATDKVSRGPFGMKLGVWMSRTPVQIPKQKLANDSPGLEKTWIRIQLVGEDRKPIANEKCKITLTDGSTIDGTTDSDGAVECTKIDAGICDVVFPDIDENAINPL